MFATYFQVNRLIVGKEIDQKQNLIQDEMRMDKNFVIHPVTKHNWRLLEEDDDNAMGMNEWWWSLSSGESSSYVVPLFLLLLLPVCLPSCGVKWNVIIKDVEHGEKHCLSNNNKRRSWRSRWKHFVHLRISFFVAVFYLLFFGYNTPEFFLVHRSYLLLKYPVLWRVGGSLDNQVFGMFI